MNQQKFENNLAIIKGDLKIHEFWIYIQFKKMEFDKINKTIAKNKKYKIIRPSFYFTVKEKYRINKYNNY